MKGIKMSDCRFYINEEERVITCVIPNTADMLTGYIEQHFQFADFDMRYLDFEFLYKKLRMPSSFMGKAVCAEGDEWNEELGRMIAFSRAKDKCYKSFFKRANLLVNTMDRRINNMITSFNDLGEKLEKKKLALNTLIEEKITPNE